jgi:hypothetical protein
MAGISIHITYAIRIMSGFTVTELLYKLLSHQTKVFLISEGFYMPRVVQYSSLVLDF